MKRFSGVSRASGIMLLAALIYVLPAKTVLANPETPAIPRSALMKLGKDFVNKIGKKFEEADILLSDQNRLKLARLKANNIIPEGERLLLHIFVGEHKLQLRSDILGYIESNRLMIAFGEFCAAADLPIEVSPDNGGSAAGWFIREDQNFFLDVAKGQVRVIDQKFDIDHADISVADGDIYISSAQIEEWFGLEININLEELALQIVTTQPFPIEERYARSELAQYQSRENPAHLPLVEEKVKLFNGPPTLDIALNASSRRSSDESETKDRLSWNVLGTGDILGVSSQTFLSGGHSSDQGSSAIRTLRQTYRKEDPDSSMLGPLHVGQIAVGDISPVTMPIVSSGGQGQGIRLSNRAAGGVTSLGTVDVEGDAQPFWDVELFQNGNRIGIQRVTENGRYNFESLFLFSGRNILRLVFYGPQGERREETREVYADTNLAGALGGVWDASVTRTNKITYAADQAKTLIDGDIRVAAKYERNIGSFGTGRVGVSSLTVTDGIDVKRKNFVQAGLSTKLMDTLFTSDVALQDDGTYTGNFLARRNYGQHRTGIVLRHSSENFSNSSLNDLPGRTSAQYLMNGPLKGALLGLTQPSYALSTQVSRLTDGQKSLLTSGTINGRRNALGLSGGLQYSITQSPDGSTTDPEDRISGSVAASGIYARGRWRLSSSYSILPFDIQTFQGEYNYPFSRNMEGLAEVTHNIDSSLSRMDLSLNWLHEDFTLSPRVTTDTNGQMVVSANMRFGLAHNPYSEKYEMFRRSTTDSGGFAGRTFLDLNGDGIFNEGEEAIEEAEIRAVQTNRRQLTNAEGIAFLPDIGRGKRTDLSVNHNSLPDVYYISMEDGISVIPRRGVTTRLDFPIVVSGEIDGAVSYALNGEGQRPARSMAMQLLTPSGQLVKEAYTGNDGFYILSAIKPGIYYAVPQLTDRAASGYIVPQLLSFTPEGTTLFGHNINLKPGYKIPFTFSATNKPPGRKTRVVRPTDVASQSVRLHLGAYRSRLALTVAWYKFKLKTKPYNGFFSLAVPLGDIEPNTEAVMTLPLTPAEPLTVTQAARICEKLIDRKFTCGVEVITTYHDHVPSSAAAAPSKGKT